VPEALTRLHRALAVVTLGFSGAFLVLGGLVLARFPALNEAANRYNAAPECSVAAAFSSDCFVRVPARIASTEVSRTRHGPLRPLVALTEVREVPGITTVTLEMVEPPPLFYQLRPGDPVLLKIYHGRPTLLSKAEKLPPLSGGHGAPQTQPALVASTLAVRTVFHPLADQYLPLVLGGDLVGIAGVMLVVMLPVPVLDRRHLRRLGDPGAPPLIRGQGGVVRRVASSRGLMAAWVLATVLQLLDVVSSVAGGRAQLFEANPATAALVRQFGDTGFLMSKVPVLILFLLLFGRMPRRFAVGMGWFTVVVMGFVVASNAWLIIHAGGGTVRPV
jgi:hypothetical protein